LKKKLSIRKGNRGSSDSNSSREEKGEIVLKEEPLSAARIRLSQNRLDKVTQEIQQLKLVPHRSSSLPKQRSMQFMS